MKIYMIPNNIIYTAVLILFLGVNPVKSQDKEQIFFNLCSEIYQLEDIQDDLFSVDYEGVKSLFFLSRSDFITDPNKRVKHNFKNNNVFYWFRKDLFFENIPYWVEILEIEYNMSDARIVFKTVNSVNSEIIRSRLKGEINLKLLDNKWVIISKNISRI